VENQGKKALHHFLVKQSGNVPRTVSHADDLNAIRGGTIKDEINSPYITIQAISLKYDEFFAWGYDVPRLQKVWHHAIEVVNSQPLSDSQADVPSAVGATSL
jgi:hypothetical protein